ncbi:hypothetical protein CYMTET_22994 [Cymbomonas tetramitiformis]|uniref:Uncharacterized protein n=1 Tax=Cymbomonas tetramitiformis TaxID=36881 RepID=A0AAE0FYQ6_9CHLO|nr:hypothetical protein CYMTET_22994 [Cymbomonas tetramitiformis]
MATAASVALQISKVLHLAHPSRAGWLTQASRTRAVWQKKTTRAPISGRSRAFVVASTELFPGAIKRQLEDVKIKLDSALQVVDMAAKRSALRDLEHQAGQETLWDLPSKAQSILQELSETKEEIAQMEDLQMRMEDAMVALEFFDEEHDTCFLEEASELHDQLVADLSAGWSAGGTGSRYPKKPRVPDTEQPDASAVKPDKPEGEIVVEPEEEREDGVTMASGDREPEPAAIVEGAKTRGLSGTGTTEEERARFQQEVRDVGA